MRIDLRLGLAALSDHAPRDPRATEHRTRCDNADDADLGEGAWAVLRIALVALLLVVVAVGCGEAGSSGAKTYDAYPAMDIPAGEPWVIVATNLGRMTFTLFPDEAPQAVNSFLFLANEGYFDGVGFHRLIPGFMVQGGDPTGLGTGGPGYKFEIEPPQRPYIRGGLAMANLGRCQLQRLAVLHHPGRPDGAGPAVAGLHALRPTQGRPQTVV